MTPLRKTSVRPDLSDQQTELQSDGRSIAARRNTLRSLKLVNTRSPVGKASHLVLFDHVLAGQHLQERRFASTIRTDEQDAAATPHLEADVR